MEPIYSAVASGKILQGTLIILDYSKLRAVNGSYIKGTTLWLFTCGQMSVTSSATASPPRHPADPRPWDLFVCVAGLSEEVQLEFQEFLRPRGLPILFAQALKQETVVKAVLLGNLEPALKQTLEIVTKKASCTAPELHKLFPEQKITVTAWNNRLNDLHALRLVRRTRAHRGWEYTPITKSIIWE